MPKLFTSEVCFVCKCSVEDPLFMNLGSQIIAICSICDDKVDREPEEAM